MPSVTKTCSHRAVALLAALATLLVTSAVFAVPAPMCDEHAQSIAAPFPILPSDNGEASASKPCEARRHFELGRAQTPERHGSSANEVVERALPAKVFAMPRDRGRQSPPASAKRCAARPGFTNGVFRPPRAR
jgi:hypothetical protein